MMRGLFITGTDTGVGKSVVARSIVRACREAGRRVGAYKPVCSGSETDATGRLHWPDVTLLADAVGEEVPADRVCPQRFHAPLAPPSAAECEGRTVDESLLTGGLAAWRDDADLLIVEGVGGLLCPLTGRATVADLAAQLGYPLIIVAALRLGVINHTLLTIEVARLRGLSIAGIVLNHATPPPLSNESQLKDNATCDQRSAHDVHASSIAEITARSPVPVLGILPFQADPRLRPPEVIRRIDWWQLSVAAPAS